MDKFTLTKNLIQYVEEYADVENGEMDLNKFSHFLQKKCALLNATAIIDQAPRHAESQIAQMLVMMNKYAKQYFKVILEGSVSQTSDELVFLIILMFEGNKTKTELIQHALQEKTTGMEILKRLENLQLIFTVNNPQDKRSKVVSITDAGILFITNIFPKMDKVSQVVCGDLSETEKDHLLHILNKLHVFHNPIFHHNTQKEILQQ